MFFIIMVMYNYIITNPNHAYTVVQDFVHHPLEDVLGAGEVPGEIYKLVASPLYVVCHQQ